MLQMYHIARINQQDDYNRKVKLLKTNYRDGIIDHLTVSHSLQENG